MSVPILPWSPEFDAAKNDAAAVQGCAAPGVLVVEDDPDTSANLADILEIDGYRVSAATSAAEVLRRDGWHDLAIIILDRRLPDGDAVALVPRLRALAPNTAVVIVTGQADLEGAITALRHGAADYILKPVNPDLLRATLTRIIERQKVDQSLRESQTRRRQEQKFVETLLDTAPSFVILLDRRGRVQRFNAAWSELTGYDLPEARGQLAAELFFSPNEAARLREKFTELANNGAVAGIISTIRRRDGQDIEVRWSAKLLLDAGGKPTAILASGQDISELKRAQDAALQSERLAAIGQTMAGLVHESRNALQRSCACAEMLALEISDRPQAVQLLGRIQRAQNDLHQLFEEVREYAAPLRLDRRPTSVAGVCRTAWQNLTLLNQDKRLRFQESGSNDDTTATIDPFAFEQIMRNLLENAIQAAPKESSIEVAIEPCMLDEKPSLRIVVRDEGPGIPDTALRKVLEPFFTTKTKGTGLGLAIAQRIVMAHGGRLIVGNGAAGGAEIIIEIPRNQHE